LDAAVADGDHVEADAQRGELWTRGEPRLGGLAEAALLLGSDHLEGIAEADAAFLLDLDEAEGASTPDDEVELVARRPGVRPEDLPAA
jgi:hypothetical protein